MSWMAASPPTLTGTRFGWLALPIHLSNSLAQFETSEEGQTTTNRYTGRWMSQQEERERQRERERKGTERRTLISTSANRLSHRHYYNPPISKSCPPLSNCSSWTDYDFPYLLFVSPMQGTDSGDCHECLAKAHLISQNGPTSLTG